MEVNSKLAGKKGMYWGRIEYDGQKAWGIVDPKTLADWTKTDTPKQQWRNQP